MAEPHGEAMVELHELREREHEAEARIDEVGRKARAAVAEREAARERLIEFERAGGGRAADRRKLEQALKTAEARAAEPWGERRRGAERAALDAHHATQLFAAKHRDELVAAIEQRGRDAAEQVDTAAERFLDAVRRRAEVDRELNATLSLVGRLKPGDVARARSDVAAQEVAKFLSRGCEAPPAVRAKLPVPVAAA
jgi:hypothetical protein